MKIEHIPFKSKVSLKQVNFIMFCLFNLILVLLFRAKTNDPVINCEDDDLLILHDEQIISNTQLGKQPQFVCIKYLLYSSLDRILSTHTIE